eukprot:NODE_2_length_91304_cov_0.692462.p62 type:complete len:166 gc:universal NODE_2_length_91304_cov_0.692462:90201-90698(+)
MNFFKYNFLPDSLNMNRITGEVKQKKLIWNDGEENYSFSIDKEVNPQNEYVLLKNKKSGKFILQKIDISRTLRYDRNVIKRSPSPYKHLDGSPTFSSLSARTGLSLTPTLIEEEILSPPVKKQKIAANGSAGNSLHSAIFGDVLEKEVGIIEEDLAPKSLNAIYQ